MRCLSSQSSSTIFFFSVGTENCLEYNLNMKDCPTSATFVADLDTRCLVAQILCYGPFLNLCIFWDFRMERRLE
jgi:hypothetical protein